MFLFVAAEGRRVLREMAQGAAPADSNAHQNETTLIEPFHLQDDGEEMGNQSSQQQAQGGEVVVENMDDHNGTEIEVAPQGGENEAEQQPPPPPEQAPLDDAIEQAAVDDDIDQATASGTGCNAPAPKAESLENMLARISLKSAQISQETNTRSVQMAESLHRVGMADQAMQAALRSKRMLSFMGRVSHVHDDQIARASHEQQVKTERKRQSWHAAKRASCTAQVFATTANEARHRKGWLASAMSTRRKGSASLGRNEYTRANQKHYIDELRKKIGSAGAPDPCERSAHCSVPTPTSHL